MPNGVTITIDELVALRRFANARALLKDEARARATGADRTRLKGRGMAFAEVRHYQAGDEIRHMEWRVTARTGRPHIKLYHEERERPILLIVDFNPSMYFGTRVAFKSVLAAKIAALLTWRAFDLGDKVGGLLYSPTQHLDFTPTSRQAHVMKFLGALATYTTLPPSERVTPLSDVLSRARRIHLPGSVMMIISDFYTFDPASEPLLLQLRQHNTLCLIHVYDPLEKALPITNDCVFTNGQDTLRLDANDPTTRAAYQTYWADHDHKIKQCCQHLGLHYTAYSAEQNLSTLLLDLLPRKSHAI